MAKISSGWFLGVGMLLSLCGQAQAATLYTQSVTLAPGWNVVSTPRVLDSHSFSTTENSTNFDIYVLDASQTAGWATMAGLGQTEFTPLYAYFIHNKTGAHQTLTLNYKSDVAPNDRLFSRLFTKTGWYSIGVANPTYAVNTGTTTVDTNNPSQILSAASGNYSSSVDFTDGAYANNQDSVAVADAWKATTASSVSDLRDLRETKGYAIYVTGTSALYNGFQNNSLPQCMDEIDNDNDGAVDYPADASCKSSFGNNEGAVVPAPTSILVVNANTVASQNINTGAPNQQLGGFDMTVTGEPVTTQRMTFSVATSSTGGGVLTSVVMVDQNGVIIAGPVDQSVPGAIVFNNAVTFPTGTHTYRIKGMLPITFLNNGTITLSTAPSSQWLGAQGQQTGNVVSLSGIGSFSMSTMTVKTGSVVLSIAATPAAQTIVAGVTQQTLSAINFDATQSGEDVKFNSAKFFYTRSTAANDVTNCNAYDGTTLLNTTAQNTTGDVTTGEDYTFNFNNMLTVTKGTVKAISIKCDVPASLTTGSVKWGINVASGVATFSGTGVSSSQTITPTSSTGAAQGGNTMSLAGAGALTVAIDTASPTYTLVGVGSNGLTGVTLGAIRFSGTNEDMRLDRVALQMSNVAASSSPNNINQVTLWSTVDSTGRFSSSGTLTQVGTAIFAGARFATSTLFNGTSGLPNGLIIPANQYAVVWTKGDLAGISLNGSGTEGALIQVDYDGNDSTGTRAVGLSSGSTINQGSSSDTAVAGVRTFRTVPTVAKLTVPSTTLVSGSANELYRFSIMAGAGGDVGLSQITANIATSSLTTTNGTTLVSNLKVYAYTDSGFSNSVPGFVSGLVSRYNSGNGVASGNNALTVNQSSQTKLEIPSGATYYFKIQGDVTQNAGTTGSAGSVITRLVGDTNYPSIAGLMGTQSQVSGSNLVWSPNATTTSLTTNVDWTNGYGVSGLPSGGTDSSTLSK